MPNRVTSRRTPKMALSRFPILNDDRGGHEKAFSIINIILVVKPAYQILLALKRRVATLPGIAHLHANMKAKNFRI